MVIKNETTELDGETFDDLFEVRTLKSYQKVSPRVLDEGIFMVKHNVQILN